MVTFFTRTLFVVLLFSRPVFAAEFIDEIERDFTLRSIGRLQVTNLRGGITIQGWALDKVRVKAKRKAIAENDEEAKKLFGALDFRYRVIDKDIELSAEYGRGLDINQRLIERQTPRTSMEMVVMAPASLVLRVLSVDGAVSVREWSGPLEVRTTAGTITIEGIKSPSVSLLCTTCSMKVTDLKGALRCMGDSASIHVKGVSGDQVYVETVSGSQTLSDVKGEQLYVATSGRINGEKLSGRIEFNSQSGDINIADSFGFFSGRTESGNISLKIKEWKFDDKAIIESVKGNVWLGLPAGLSADLELMSVHGAVKNAFKLKSLPTAVYGPQPANMVRGRVGDGGEQLRVSSINGNVEIASF